MLKYPYSDWHFQDSGLAVVKFSIYPEAYTALDNFDNLVYIIMKMQNPKKGAQADIQYNPFRLTKPHKDTGVRTLYILTNSTAVDTTCWGLLADLRSYVKDAGGQYQYVGAPEHYMNQTHGHIVKRGFPLDVYHPWAAKYCSKYRQPKPKKVVDSMCA